MYIVYVIEHTKTQDRYIGKTSNLKKRVFEHNRGKQTATKRVSGEWILVYAEAYRSKSDADVRERRLKSHGRAKQEMFKRIKDSFLS